MFDALKQTAIPAKVFHPTHVTRNPVLFEQALDFLELGGWIDLTAAHAASRAAAKTFCRPRSGGWTAAGSP